MWPSSKGEPLCVAWKSISRNRTEDRELAALVFWREVTGVAGGLMETDSLVWTEGNGWAA
ncbi:hypothetical protein ACWD0J_29480 [Streptomyces sp. NPDC003011]